MSQITTPAELRAAYPYQFAKPLREGAFEWYRGWFPLVAHACQQVDALVRDDRFKHRFHFLQLKEKFGTLRMYWRARGVGNTLRVDLFSEAGVTSLESVPTGGTRDALVAREIRNVVRAAEAASGRTCIVCGAAGTVRQGGWVLTLCDEHARARKQLPDFGFSAAEGGIDPL